MGALQIAGTLALVYFLYSLFRLTKNYSKVRKCGFPITISPTDAISPGWLIISPLVLPVLKRVLPFRLWRPLDLCTYGYEWRDYVAGRRRPSSWMLVSPGKRIDLYIEDPELANAILGKRKDFPLDEISMKFLNVVGDNLASSEGEDWQRQRRLIAPLLNERIMETVWQESCEQAEEMVGSFIQAGGKTDRSIEGLTRIAFNVLQRVGYGVPHKWGEDSGEVPSGHKLTYMDAVKEMVSGFIMIAITRGSKLLKLPFLPKSTRRKGYAIDDFITYTRELLAKEREAGLESDTPRTNFLSLMAQISEKTARGKVTGVQPQDKQTLSEEEIRGNLYQFTLAGFDTTANTLAYAVTTLAAVPEWQDWIANEIDEVERSVGNAQAGYAETFPRLERCLAVMFETLRLFTPVAHLVRECSTDQTITSNGKTYHIPAGTRVTVVLQGVHEQESVWGRDQANYRPTRWIQSTQEGSKPILPASGSAAQAPILQLPAKGAFVPWSSGPRICPGMKMAQVEFLAVMWTIFRQYRIEAAPLGNESPEAARTRLRNVILDSHPKLTLQINKPRKAILRWTKRKEH